MSFSPDYPEPLAVWPKYFYRVTSSITAGAPASMNPPFVAPFFQAADSQIPIEDVFPHNERFLEMCRSHLEAKKFSTPFISVTTSLQYALAVCYTHAYRRSIDPRTIWITIIDTAKLPSYLRIWNGKQLVKDFQMGKLANGFKPEDESGFSPFALLRSADTFRYLVYGCIESDLPAFIRQTYLTLDKWVNSLEPNIAKSKPFFSGFWSSIPKNVEPGHDEARCARRFAKELCSADPELLVPLIVQAMLIRPRFKWNKSLFQTVTELAHVETLREPAALAAYYGHIGTATSVKDGRRKDIPIYDFLGWSSWTPDATASVHVKTTYRCLNSLASKFLEEMEQKVFESCGISVFGYLMCMRAQGKANKVLAVADTGLVKRAAEMLQWDERSVELAETFTQFKNEFSAQTRPVRFSLRWLQVSLEECYHRGRKDPDLMASRGFWNYEIRRMMRYLSPSNKRKRVEEEPFSLNLSLAQKRPRPNPNHIALGTKRAISAPTAFTTPAKPLDGAVSTAPGLSVDATPSCIATRDVPTPYERVDRAMQDVIPQTTEAEPKYSTAPHEYGTNFAGRHLMELSNLPAKSLPTEPIATFHVTLMAMLFPESVGISSDGSVAIPTTPSTTISSITTDENERARATLPTAITSAAIVTSTSQNPTEEVIPSTVTTVFKTSEYLAKDQDIREIQLMESSSIGSTVVGSSDSAGTLTRTSAKHVSQTNISPFESTCDSPDEITKPSELAQPDNLPEHQDALMGQANDTVELSCPTGDLSANDTAIVLKQLNEPASPRPPDLTAGKANLYDLVTSEAVAVEHLDYPTGGVHEVIAIPGQVSPSGGPCIIFSHRLRQKAHNPDITIAKPEVFHEVIEVRSRTGSNC